MNTKVLVSFYEKIGLASNNNRHLKYTLIPRETLHAEIKEINCFPMINILRVKETDNLTGGLV